MAVGVISVEHERDYGTPCRILAGNCKLPSNCLRPFRAPVNPFLLKWLTPILYLQDFRGGKNLREYGRSPQEKSRVVRWSNKVEFPAISESRPDLRKKIICSADIPCAWVARDRPAPNFQNEEVRTKVRWLSLKREIVWELASFILSTKTWAPSPGRLVTVLTGSGLRGSL